MQIDHHFTKTKNISGVKIAYIIRLYQLLPKMHSDEEISSVEFSSDGHVLERWQRVQENCWKKITNAWIEILYCKRISEKRTTGNWWSISAISILSISFRRYNVLSRHGCVRNIFSPDDKSTSIWIRSSYISRSKYLKETWPWEDISWKTISYKLQFLKHMGEQQIMIIV